MLQLLEDGNLADGRARYALVLSLQPNFLESHELAVDSVPGLVHHTVRPFPDLLHLLIFVCHVAVGAGPPVAGASSTRRARWPFRPTGQLLGERPPPSCFGRVAETLMKYVHCRYTMASRRRAAGRGPALAPASPQRPGLDAPALKAPSCMIGRSLPRPRVSGPVPREELTTWPLERAHVRFRT